MLEGGGEDEVNKRGTSDLNREAEETEWVDMAPVGEVRLSGSEGGEEAELETSALRRPKNFYQSGEAEGEGERRLLGGKEGKPSVKEAQ